jgi:hypothetical protein
MVDSDTHRKLAVSLFNRTWELMEAPRTTVEQDDEMLSTAHASAYHWLQVGQPKNFAISHWQLARAYALLKRPQSAIYHGWRSLDICKQHGLAPFFHAYGHEAIARGHLVAGEESEARNHMAAAESFLPLIDEAEDRATLAKDLGSLGLTSSNTG